MALGPDEANDVFLALLRVQKLLVASKHTAPRVHDGVDVAAYPVLFVVARRGAIRISDVATTLHSDVSTVSRQVSALVVAGVLEKRPDPSDGRASVVSLTHEGHAALDRIQESRSRWFQGLLRDWEPDDAIGFIDRLESLGDLLDANLRARGEQPPELAFAPTRGTRSARATQTTRPPDRPQTRES